ncbi:Heme ligase [Babesia microti strain RI]|uniref:Heme ligase n=1 Tax=Babesia microti (strain RI) TaxID=1133968 RepID=A0A1N6LWP5_BABMR|nr:Heme ligase [Babesia microti strain RI]SIO73294.1 Heme ligase [Babesia microti strain RI]|eukprot:XP_021337398.1 Heme ligase [Babesia microti strain RI]
MLSLTHRKLVTDLNKSISRGVFKQKPQVTKNPESINHRVYWWSEHRPYRRTVLDICRIITHTRSFHSLINPQSLIGSELVHKLSLPGPFTGFIPVNSAISQSIKGLDDRSLSNFILSHFVSEYYLHRDIIGSTQSNLACSNEIRQKITSLDNLSGQTLEFVRDVNEIGETIIRVNNAEVLRWNLKCHNGVIHIINNTLV